MDENNTKNIIKTVLLIIVLTVILLVVNSLVPKPDPEILVRELDDTPLYLEVEQVINDLQKEEDYIDARYSAENIYYKEKDTVKVLFINGYITYIDNEPVIINNVNYVMKLDSITYEIAKIENADDIKEYAEDYEMDDLEITDANILPSIITDTKTILTVYIQRFLRLANNDPSRAYNLLTKKEQAKFDGKEDFENNALEYYKDITPLVKSYDDKTSGNKTTYNIKDENDNNITIIETRSMQFQIEFN